MQQVVKLRVGSADVSRGRPQLVLRCIPPRTDRKSNNGMRAHARHHGDKRGRRSLSPPVSTNWTSADRDYWPNSRSAQQRGSGHSGCQYDHQSVPAAGSVDRSHARALRRINSADNFITAPTDNSPPHVYSAPPPVPYYWPSPTDITGQLSIGYCQRSATLINLCHTSTQ